jgi:hypothetical protein
MAKRIKEKANMIEGVHKRQTLAMKMAGRGKRYGVMKQLSSPVQTAMSVVGAVATDGISGLLGNPAPYDRGKGHFRVAKGMEMRHAKDASTRQAGRDLVRRGIESIRSGEDLSPVHGRKFSVMAGVRKLRRIIKRVMRDGKAHKQAYFVKASPLALTDQRPGTKHGPPIPLKSSSYPIHPKGSPAFLGASHVSKIKKPSKKRKAA